MSWRHNSHHRETQLCSLETLEPQKVLIPREYVTFSLVTSESFLWQFLVYKLCSNESVKVVDEASALEYTMLF